MLYEYAVEPQAIGSDWHTFRYVIEKFGFDKGRLISQFPKRWFREVYEAAEGLTVMQRKRIEEALAQAKKNKIARFGRPYDHDLGGWLENALVEHSREPFHAIIAAANPGGDGVILCTDDLDENDKLMAVAHDCAIPRDVDSLVTVLHNLLRFGSRIVFVDPFFNPYSKRQRRLYFRCLSIVKNSNPHADCEVHYRYHENKSSNSELERDARTLFRDIIPEGLVLTVLCWKERDGGEDFHARYLLTDKGGVRVDAGFDPVGKHQKTDMTLMDYRLSQMRLASVARGATDYELIEPVLRISAGGEVEHI